VEQLFRDYFWIIFAVLGMIIPIVAIVSTFRTRQRELDILRTYAERGAEPPQQVLDAIMVRPRPQPLGRAAWPQFAFFFVMALGFGGLAMWLAPYVSAFIFTFASAVTAVVMAALALRHLVAALSAPRDGG
jgi:hypothetical protein